MGKVIQQITRLFYPDWEAAASVVIAIAADAAIMVQAASLAGFASGTGSLKVCVI